MAKVSLAEHMKERPVEPGGAPEEGGPFITISRQYGCWGFSLALLLLEILNEDAPPEKIWKLYNQEILQRLATETKLAAEMLEKQRKAKPHLLVDVFRSLSGTRVPSGAEIRNRITTLIRGLCIEGHAIIVGQGSAGATHDLPRGLSIRMEAPEDWRVRQVAFREGFSESKARQRVRAVESEREHLRKIYEMKFPRKPAFHLVYDCSVFTLAQIAQQVVYAMKLRGLV